MKIILYNLFTITSVLSFTPILNTWGSSMINMNNTYILVTSRIPNICSETIYGDYKCQNNGLSNWFNSVCSIYTSNSSEGPFNFIKDISFINTGGITFIPYGHNCIINIQNSIIRIDFIIQKYKHNNNIVLSGSRLYRSSDLYIDNLPGDIYQIMVLGYLPINKFSVESDFYFLEYNTKLLKNSVNPSPVIDKNNKVANIEINRQLFNIIIFRIKLAHTLCLRALICPITSLNNCYQSKRICYKHTDLEDPYCFINNGIINCIVHDFNNCGSKYKNVCGSLIKMDLKWNIIGKPIQLYNILNIYNYTTLYRQRPSIYFKNDNEFMLFNAILLNGYYNGNYWYGFPSFTYAINVIF